MGHCSRGGGTSVIGSRSDGASNCLPHLTIRDSARFLPTLPRRNTFMGLGGRRAFEADTSVERIEKQRLRADR